jgi:hypothetical protein
MPEVSPAIVARIVRELTESGGTRSAADLARRHLGLGLLDESTAEKLLEPVLSEDSRLLRTPAGWRASRRPQAEAAGCPRLDEPHLVVAAPASAGGACSEILSGIGEPRYAVALGGHDELAAYRRARDPDLALPAVPLAQVARRLGGYRGGADPVRIAEILGAPHVEAEGLDGWTATVAACWEHLRTGLAAEGLTDLDDLARLLADKAERADFAGKNLSAQQIRELPERPGVYVFRDEAGKALYVGQSGNLRARVSSYFVGPPRDDKDRILRREAHGLTVHPTDTGLDAWILELRTIRRLRPRMNSRRQVSEGSVEDGWLLVPDPARHGRAVLFTLWQGRLAGRRVIPSSAGRRARALAAALAPDAGAAPRADATAAGRLALTWHRLHPAHPLLRLGIDGSREHIARALTAYLAEARR